MSIYPKPAETIDDYEKRLRGLFRDYEKYIEYVNELADDYATAFEGTDTHVESVTVEDGKVYASAFSHNNCGCCETYPRHFDFPVKYLWEQDWEQKERQIRLDRNLAALKKGAEDAEQKKEKALEERLRLYHELKKEFEQEDMS